MTVRLKRRRPWPVRIMELLTCVHLIHHRNFGYGYVFLPLMVAYFQDYAKVYDTAPNSPWKFVRPQHFHDCTWTGIS